ncbi:MAG: hypothetical protein O2779_04225 [Nanoarchaeota archaeon]|nr:hypothetical protein [Nanoarchaeota archaeon]
MEFNPDGSIKLPSYAIKKKQNDKFRLTSAHCLQVTKEVVDFHAPKKCTLHIKLSDKIQDTSFVRNIHKRFDAYAEVPTKIKQIGEKEFDVEIGTCFRRCTDCTKFIGMLKEHMVGNVIENKGNCTFEPYQKNFEFEDYFDD